MDEILKYKTWNYKTPKGKQRVKGPWHLSWGWFFVITKAQATKVKIYQWDCIELASVQQKEQ